MQNIYRKVLGASVVSKSRLGFLVATVALVTIGGKMAITETKLLEPYSAFICIGLGLTGFICWGAGRWGEVRKARLVTANGPTAEQAAVEDPLSFLRSSKYWGLIIIISAAMLTGAVSYSRPKAAVTAYRQVTITNIVTVTITNVVTITNQKPVVKFPALELAGVVVNGDRSSAVINGRVLRIGEMIGAVTLVSVDSTRAVVALEGETNVLVLRK
jgi:hypothetical protein